METKKHNQDNVIAKAEAAEIQKVLKGHMHCLSKLTYMGEKGKHKEVLWDSQAVTPVTSHETGYKES